MLTKITAYSQWANVDPLVFNVINRPETDKFEIRNIEGLGSVKADVNTQPKGSTAGSNYVGSNVGERNIVLTVGLDPDWNEWTVSRLRRLLDKFFIPQMAIRLVIETMEFSPVEISGYVEANDPNMFSKDPEHQISIICPDLYFRSVDPVVIIGDTTTVPWPIEYEGNVETGVTVRVSKLAGAAPTVIQFQVEDPNPNWLQVGGGVDPLVDTSKDLYLSSIPGDKYLRTIPNTGGVVVPTSLLASKSGEWTKIGPATDTFQVLTNAGSQSWVLQYYNLFGSL